MKFSERATSMQDYTVPLNKDSSYESKDLVSVLLIKPVRLAAGFKTSCFYEIAYVLFPTPHPGASFLWSET